MIGFAMTGSFCTHGKALQVLRSLVERGEEVLPIVSDSVRLTDTRFGRAQELMEQLNEICGRRPILTIAAAEPLGPKNPLEAMLICPCTGNSRQAGKRHHRYGGDYGGQGSSTSRSAAGAGAGIQRCAVGKSGNGCVAVREEERLPCSHVTGRPDRQASLAGGALFHGASDS